MLTGGEPIEHYNIINIIKEIHKRPSFFRIATGGHVPLRPYLSTLMATDNFMGFAIGTDILIPKRNKKNELQKIWKKNIRWLNHWNINYSITITIDNSFEWDFILNKIKNLKAKPHMITLTEIEKKSGVNYDQNLANQTIHSYYPDIEITYGFIN